MADAAIGERNTDMKGIRHTESIHMKKLSPANLLRLKDMKRIIFAALLFMVFSQIALADDTAVVESLLKEKIDNIMATLGNKDLDSNVKEKKIEEAIEPIINFPLMSMLVLGKEAWTSLADEDQKRFIELFGKTIKETLISKIQAYVDEKIIIEKSEQASEKKVNISTAIVSKDKNIPVVYKFYRAGKDWNIYDVEIEGVSILKNFKAQFTDNLQEMTAKELIVKMEKANLSK